MPSFSERIQQDSDDGSKASGLWSSTSNFLSWCGVGDTVALRFSNVTIPAGSVINSATIQFTTPSFGDGNNGLKSKVYGIAEDNTATFSSDPTGRTQTSSNIEWDQNSVVGNSTYTSPDISSVVQEVINRAGWASGNALGFLIVDGGSANNNTHLVDDYHWDTTKAALLTVTYTIPSGANITKTLKYTIKTTPPAITKLLRYFIPDQEKNLVPFRGLKVAKPGHNVLKTKDPNNLIFSSDYNTLKYFQNGQIALNVNEPVTTLYTVKTNIAHNLGYFPFAIVYAQDNIMANPQPLGRFQLGSGAYRQFYYYMTTTNIYFVATGYTGTISGDSYTVNFYYKVFSNNLGL